MSFFRKLFGISKSPQSPNEMCSPAERRPTKLDKKGTNVQNASGMLSVSTPTPYFFGNTRVAPQKQWSLGLDEINGQSHEADRDAGNGLVVMANVIDDEVAWTSDAFERPVDGAVADTGDCLIHDAGSRLELGGTVIALDREGNVRFSRRYTANVFTVAISPCGRYGVVQTANAESEDSNILELLDLAWGKIQFTVKPHTSWSTKYTFNVAQDGVKNLWVHLDKLGKFAYSASGEFLDAEKYQTSRLEKGDYSEALLAAQDLLKAGRSPENAVIAQTAAERALAEGARTQPYWEAIGHRVRAESLEIQGRLAEAIQAYDEALRINPKIGVKRKADSIRKKLIAD